MLRVPECLRSLLRSVSAWEFSGPAQGTIARCLLLLNGRHADFVNPHEYETSPEQYLWMDLCLKTREEHGSLGSARGLVPFAVFPVSLEAQIRGKEEEVEGNRRREAVVNP